MTTWWRLSHHASRRSAHLMLRALEGESFENFVVDRGAALVTSSMRAVSDARKCSLSAFQWLYDTGDIRVDDLGECIFSSLRVRDG